MSYTCPYCFTPVRAKDIWFQCSVPSCVRPDEIRTRFKNDLQPHQPLPQGIKPENYRTVFQSQTQNGGVCPQCRRATTIRACPVCHSPFPPGIENLSNAVFAIVGGRSTGKSHYIAVLIHQLKILYKKFNWTLCALNDETMDIYRRIYYEPLFMKNIPVKQTAGALGNTEQNLREPLIYSLNFYGKNSQSVVIAFFDSAGEDLTSISNMEKVNRYIANSSGIILLLDPVQITNIRNKIKTSNPPNESYSHYQNHIIENLTNLINRNNKITKKIPLAVTLSKIDLLRGHETFRENYDRFELPIAHTKEVVKINEWQSNSEFLEDWLDSQAAVCIQAAKEFDSSFFGVSALGKDPNQDNNNQLTIPGGPIPLHVEDPFLWLLYKNGFIRGK